MDRNKDLLALFELFAGLMRPLYVVPWTSFEVTYREMDVRDGIAWVAEEVTGLWSRDTESGATHFRITTGWGEEGEAWKIRHAHIDLPLD
jgi:hypothetical protein